MNPQNAEKILQAGLDNGADFAELFIEETRNASVSFQDNRVETATAGISYGVGLRLLFGTDVLYASSSNDDPEHLIKLLKNLAFTRKSSNFMSIKGNYSDKSKSYFQKILKDPSSVTQDQKLPFLKRANESARKVSPKITQVTANALDVVSEIQIFNSEGVFAEDRRILSRFSVGVTASENNERFSASESPGKGAGFEFFESLQIEDLAQTAAERAILMLSAGYIQGKKMPVIMGPGFGGVIFHEACGHPLETEAIRKKASPFTGKLGEQIAHPSLTAIDEGDIDGSWGSIKIDDEGYPVEKTVLIEKGILKNYISDMVGAKEVGVRRTGSARRESFHYAPVSRMRNTYIDRGNDSFEEMLSSVKEGLYAKKMGGGSVNPATGEFNFAVEEGYIIRNGKIEEPVRGATLIGKGDEILQKISMIGKDLEITAGMCGATSGSVPVTVGQPTIKVDEILVGGR